MRFQLQLSFHLKNKCFSTKTHFYLSNELPILQNTISTIITAHLNSEIHIQIVSDKSFSVIVPIEEFVKYL